MPLTRAVVQAAFGWTLSKANPGRKPTAQQDDLRYGAQPDVTVTNQVYVGRLTFTANGTQTIDLRAFTNLAGEAVVLAKVNGVIVAPVGCAVAVKPGAANGVNWPYLPAAGVPVPDGGVELHYEPTAVTVDATHKTIDVTATMTGGVTSATVDVAILGGT